MSQQPDTSSGLDISVDRSAEIPIGVQLAWALRSRIRDGRFEPGQRLPGLREVAEATGVNVNTVRTVYQRLEQEGLIDSQQGSGTFVAAKPQQQAAAAARGAARPSSDDAAERRRALRGQIASLERTLGEIEATHPGVAPAREATRAGIGPTLLDAEELEQVRTMLVRRLATVQAAIDGLGGEAGADEPAAVTATTRKPRAKPAGVRAPRARPPMRPAPEGA